MHWRDRNPAQDKDKGRKGKGTLHALMAKLGPFV